VKDKLRNAGKGKSRNTGTIISLGCSTTPFATSGSLLHRFTWIKIRNESGGGFRRYEDGWELENLNGKLVASRRSPVISADALSQHRPSHSDPIRPVPWPAVETKGKLDDRIVLDQGSGSDLSISELCLTLKTKLAEAMDSSRCAGSRHRRGSIFFAD
jgi:hypothetical protein